MDLHIVHGINIKVEPMKECSYQCTVENDIYYMLELGCSGWFHLDVPTSQHQTLVSNVIDLPMKCDTSTVNWYSGISMMSGTLPQFERS